MTKRRFRKLWPTIPQVSNLAIALAWTDPPSNDGSLVHDLNLEVQCDVSSWLANLGNGGSSPDTVNNVEKVLLLGYESLASVFCIAKVGKLCQNPGIISYRFFFSSESHRKILDFTSCQVLAPAVPTSSPQPLSLVASGFRLSPCGAQMARAPDCGLQGSAVRPLGVSLI